MSSLASLRELTLTRVRVMLREPEMIFWVFAFPALLALGLGVAFSNPTPELIPIAIERDSRAAFWADELNARPELDVRVVTPFEADLALRRGEVALVVAGSPGVVFRFDPTRPDGRNARLAAESALQEAAGATLPLSTRTEEVRQRGRRYIDWLIPGLIGFNLMSTGLWAVGFFVTKSRQNLQLKRLVSTPMRRSHYLLSQILARFVFLPAEILVLVLFAWLIFDVQVEGNLVSLGVVTLVGAACFTGFGLLASSRVRSTEAVSGIINVISMPMVLLCGVFFSPARFPDQLQPLIGILPLTALNDALRAVYNDGLPLGAVTGELVILGVWTGITFVAALRLFRWQ